MDEFGEERSIYVWPKDQVEGEPYPEDFWQRLWAALDAGGFAGEPT